MFTDVPFVHSYYLPSYHAVQRAVTAVVVEVAVQAIALICYATGWQCLSIRYRFVPSLATPVSDMPSGRSHTVDWTTAIGLAKPSISSSGTVLKLLAVLVAYILLSLCVLQALSIPYCQSTWLFVCGHIMSASLRLKISET